ncbi:MAG: sulfatase-like hydrolase/transferase [Opitutaceae bacterium]
MNVRLSVMQRHGRFLATLLLALLSALPAVAAPSQRPNLIVILTDDLGYGDPGCYGGKLVPTPAIDSLAAGGIRFTNAYATAPVCGPSRCGLLTGAYNQRFGCQWNEDEWPQQGMAYKIPAGHLTLPEALRAAGYVTGHLGKWNITRDPRQCFDEVADVIGFEADYFPDAAGHYQGMDEPVRKNSKKVMGVSGPERPGDEYLTDRLGRHAVEFIERHQRGEKPFFLFLSFNAPHSPYHAKSTDMAKMGDIRPEPLNYYAAMVASLDENIGRVLAKLESAGIAENTVVVFTSDNGPTGALRVGWKDHWPKELIVGSAGPLRGHKGQFLEGGVREPFLVRWPARLPAGRLFHAPVSTMDIFPTLSAAAGASLPDSTRLNGVDLLPYLLSHHSGAPHPVLYWKNGEQGAIREGDWKLLIDSASASPQLYHLASDIGEAHDRAHLEPAVVQRLHQSWREWSSTLPPRSNPQRPRLDSAP